MSDAHIACVCVLSLACMLTGDLAIRPAVNAESLHVESAGLGVHVVDARGAVAVLLALAGESALQARDFVPRAFVLGCGVSGVNVASGACARASAREKAFRSLTFSRSNETPGSSPSICMVVEAAAREGDAVTARTEAAKAAAAAAAAAASGWRACCCCCSCSCCWWR